MKDIKDTYRTITGPAEGLYKEKGSRFLAFAYPATSEDEVKALMQPLKKQYYDARHHCYAYVFGYDGEVYRANDDGEPNHTAGDPILGQIRSNELTNVVIIVVRYFGGTKLGVPGLISAYKLAAADAISNSQIVERLITKPVSIHFKYPELNLAMKMVKDYELEIASQKFELECDMSLNVRLGQYDMIIKLIKDTYGLDLVPAG